MDVIISRIDSRVLFFLRVISLSLGSLEHCVRYVSALALADFMYLCFGWASLPLEPQITLDLG